MVGILEETMTSLFHSEFNWPLALVYLIPYCLVLAEIKCTGHVALPKRPINQFKLVHQSRKRLLRNYCPNIRIYTVSWVNVTKMPQMQPAKNGAISPRRPTHFPSFFLFFFPLPNSVTTRKTAQRKVVHDYSFVTIRNPYFLYFITFLFSTKGKKSH